MTHLGLQLPLVRRVFLPSDLPDGLVLWVADDDPGALPPVAGACTSIPNRGGLGGTLDSVATAGDSTLNARRARQFDANGDYYQSSLASSSWKFLHDGTTACTLVTVVRLGNTNGNQLIWTTYDGNANSVGVFLNYNGNTGTHEYCDFRVANGSGTAYIDIVDAGNGSVPNNTTRIVTVQWGTSLTPVAQIRVNGVQQATDTAVSGSPSASNPSYTLRNGFTTNATLDGYNPETALWSRALSIAELQRAERYLADRWGVTL